MRNALAVTTLAGLALFAGAGPAGAQTAPADTTTPAPTTPPLDLTTNPTPCVTYIGWDGTETCLRWAPVAPTGAGSLGYGSAGTGSLADLVSMLVSTGSSVLSLELPAATGSYDAPGSTGSYGPEAVLGQFSATSVGSLTGGRS